MTSELNDLEALAAEYALGVLESADRRRAEILLARDAAFARQVDAWNRRLAPLLEAIPPERVSPEVWQRIQAAVRARGSLPNVQLAVSNARPVRRPPLIERLGFWRWCTAGASVVAAMLAVYIALSPVSPTLRQDDRYVAVLDGGGSEPAWLITVDLATEELTIRPVVDMAPGDRAMELWLVAGSDAPPRSLGLLDPQGQQSLALPAAWTESATQLAALAISLEPQGGSPTGLPTGPVIFQGRILSLK